MLLRNKIVHVFNAMGYELKGPKDSQHIYYHSPSYDVSKCVMNIYSGEWKIQEFLNILQDIDVEIDTGSALVHCLKGANRSGIVVICYVMAKTGCLFKEAYKHCQFLRPVINIDAKFGWSVTGAPFVEHYEEEVRLCIKQYRRIVLQEVVNEFKWLCILNDNRAELGDARCAELGLALDAESRDRLVPNTDWAPNKKKLEPQIYS